MPSPDVSEAELAVLEQLWHSPGATARELANVLYEGRAAAQKTVKKLLDRLQAKGCVRRTATRPVQRFEASIDRAALIDRRIRAVAESLCDGSVTPILTHMVEAAQLSKKERDALRKLIDELDRGGKQRGRTAKRQQGDSSRPG